MCDIIYMKATEMINLTQLGLFTYKRENENRELENYSLKALKNT